MRRSLGRSAWASRTLSLARFFSAVHSMNHLELTPYDAVLGFGPFTLQRQQRLVCEAGRPLVLGGRALEILLVLVEHAGQFVSKDRLIARVWPSSVVEEINLRVHIAALRRALGDGRDGQRYIVNLPQRGYCFVAPVQHLGHGAGLGAAPGPSAPRLLHNLPARLSPVIGRDELLGSLARRLSGQRLMTLTGPAGVGKSTLALRLAQLRLPRCRDGAWLIDLATLREPSALIKHLADTLGLDLQPLGSLDSLCQQLASRQMLLLLDGCEQLLAPCRALVLALLKAAPELSLLLSSREALQVPGEWVQNVAVLAVPPLSALRSVNQALAYSAVQLFVSRACASQQGFSLRQQDLLALRGICQRLDGLPLALELAAAQVDALGIAGLQLQLDNGLQVLSQGRRTAVGRHQSLSAALDWSYECLSLPEQWLLQRLALFEGAFTPQAVRRVIDGSALEHADLGHLLARLAAQSLLLVEQRSGPLRYRLLNTTRRYARDTLSEPLQLQRLQQRYAHYIGRLGSSRELAVQGV